MKFAYIYRLDTDNPGDLHSSPMHYIGDRQGIVVDVFTDNIPEMEVDVLVIGGGALMTNKKFVRNLNTKLENIHARHTVVWGVGFEPNNIDIGIKNQFDLFSTREYKLDSTVDWVPCISALHPMFDEISNMPVVNDFLVVDHFKRTIPFNKPHTRIINRPNNIRTLLGQIASHNFIVTSSYHVAYWSILAGKKCAVIGDSLPGKFNRMKHFPVIADQWDDSLVDIAQVWPNARYESVYANYKFHRKFENLIGVSKPAQLSSMKYEHLKKD